MNKQFSLYDLLILFGIIQGIIFSVLLFFSKKNIKSNKFLALAILAFCLLSSKTLLHTLNLWNTVSFKYFPNGVELALSPLIYFYVKSLITPKFAFKPIDWLHFLPFFISQTFAFVVYFAVFNTADLLEKDAIASSLKFDNVKIIEEYLQVISLSVYLFLGYKKLKSYKKWLNNTISDNTYPNFDWLNNIFKISIFILFFLILNNSLDLFFNLKSSTVLHWNILILFITIIFYYLGFKGYMQPDYSFNENVIPLENNEAQRISSSNLLEIVAKLEKAIVKDKFFLNPKLTIFELSNSLKIPKRTLSKAINQHYKSSFRDFINTYRLQEVKSKLIDANNNNLSILGIALESGFNSEASFYRIFKKSTGLSPKDFIQKSTKNTSFNS